MNFEDIYQKNILSRYPNEKIDDIYPIDYIDSKINRTAFKYPVYSIDPEGCEDADDGFSLWTENNKTFLAIHIADPTAFIPIDSGSNSLFQLLKKKCLSYYPSNYKPIHMLPKKILSRSSLIEDSDESSIKFAISLILEIDKITFLPINTSFQSLNFTIINCNNKFRYNYETACLSNDNIIKYCIKIGSALRRHRCKSIKLNSKTKIKFKEPSKVPYYHNISNIQLSIQHMIEEFAIYANSFVGNYLYYHLCLKNIAGNYYNAIFRSCKVAQIYSKSLVLKNENEIFSFLINEGISAKYTNNPEYHDMINREQLYTHFTSPIRRFSDCICHYLLKFIHIYYKNENKISIPPPFSANELKYMIDLIHIKSKFSKKVSLEDNKFRNIQCIHSYINKSLQVKINCEYNGFIYVNELKYINILISEVNVIKVNTWYNNLFKKNEGNKIKKWEPFQEEVINSYSVKLSSSFIIDDNEWNIELEKYLPKKFYFTINNMNLVGKKLFTKSGKIKDNIVFNELYLHLKRWRNWLNFQQ